MPELGRPPVKNREDKYHIIGRAYSTMNPRCWVNYIQFSITEPSTGTVHQAVQANEVVVTKKFLNSRCGKWQPIPAAWEASQPDVVKMLKEIDSTLPEWGSVAEQILALRMCDYNIQVSPKSCKLNVQAN